MTPADLKRITAIRADLASGRAREARERTGATVAEIAATMSGTVRTTPQAVSAYELGQTTPGTARALAYAKALAAAEQGTA